MFIEVVTSSERLSQFKDELAAADITFEIVSVTPSPDPATLLTDRQREFIIEAVTRGYYATPRQCSLTDLADAMGVTKGSASRVLHRAEEAIITEFVAAIPSQWTNTP
jgi:predicted DNA binding protein